MNKNNPIDVICKKIEIGRPLEAIQLLKRISDDVEINKDLSLQAARCIDLNNRLNNGILDIQEANLIRNQINSALLYITYKVAEDSSNNEYIQAAQNISDIELTNFKHTEFKFQVFVAFGIFIILFLLCCIFYIIIYLSLILI